ncbi:amino acid ABC transporter substrate-binding protein [Bosea caraganae]|uniref:Amino acid ABC transporter substrate-binding protein n=1 Tax=Bosea caraganae TaxID=2763117 RepID=A0A370L9S1_9HYPH|nr:ABC transporter substrate-binding protein [Bosea caraganae]RDJ21893.1 amino acid ABC transporter substrate-binding protein [Bosea caraganae]RDJ28075.1 amino acid ABC transporter substrate-binding protein [Bosea caraganae]
MPTCFTRLAAGAVSLLAIGLSGTASAQEIVIGAVLPLTGPAAPTGIEEQTGVQFAVDGINAAGGIRGRKVKVIYEDSQGKPDQGVLAFNRLVDLHSTPAIVTAFSSISLAMAPLATRKKVFVVNPAAQTNKLATASPYLVNTIPLVADEVAVMTKYAVAKLGKKAAIIYENAAAGIDARDDFKKAFVAAGGEILADEAVEFGQTNFRPTLLKVAAAKPDFVFIGITVGAPTMADQVAQVPGFPIAIGTTFNRPFSGFASTAGWFHTGIKSGIAPEAEAEFNNQFGTKEMGFFAREYANATQIIFKIIDSLIAKNIPVTGENIRTALFEIKNFDSPTAKIVFDSNTARREIEVLKLVPPGREVVETGTN